MRLVVPKIKIVRVDNSEVDFVPKKLEDFLTDITSVFAKLRKASYRTDYIHGREREIEQVFTCCMLNTNNNVLLVGDHGVGKKAIIQAAVNKVLDKDCPKSLEHLHFFALDTEKVAAIVMSDDKKANKKISQLFKYLTNNSEDEIVLFIDKIHLLLHSSYLSFQLYKLLRMDNIRVVGTLTEEDMYEFYYLDESRITCFNIISVEEPQYSEIYAMISENVEITAAGQGVNITEDIIRYAIALSTVFPSELSCPGNILKNIEKAMIIAKCEMHQYVTREDVKRVFDFDFELFNGISDDEKKLLAYHEAGHCVTINMSKNIKNVDAKVITIIPSDYFLGVTSFDFDLKKQICMDLDYYIDTIAGDLGGRVAEEILLGEEFKPSTGAASDLKTATQFARQVITIYGLTSNSGNMTDFCGYNDILDYSLLSENRKKNIEKEVQKIIELAYDRAKAILLQESELLEAIALELLSNEVLDEYDIDRICSQVHNK